MIPAIVVKLAGSALAMFTGINLRKVAMYGAAGLVLVFGAYTKGKLDERARNNVAQLRVTIRTLQADLAAEKKLSAQVLAARDDIAAKSEQLASQVSQYEQELSTRASGACTLDDADLRRLLSIGR